MIEPSGTKPTCVAIGGCLGSPWCDYCGHPRTVARDARSRLAALIARLRADLERREAA